MSCSRCNGKGILYDRIRYRMAQLGKRSILYECDEGTMIKDALQRFQRDDKTGYDYVVKLFDGTETPPKEIIKDKTTYMVIPRINNRPENIIRIKLPFRKRMFCL